jgi:serine/threonine protein kinase/uncharacterized protein YfaT (DUF1175 family)
MSDGKVLTREIAEQFLADENTVRLSEFTTIEDAAAESLSKHEGAALDLSAITQLSDSAAESLSKHEGAALELSAITQLSDSAAESLSKYEGGLHLDGLTSLSDVAAESFSNHKGDWLDLKGLTILSDAAAESLSKYEGPLDLDGLASLSDAAAESLSKYVGLLLLSGLTQLSDPAAESLGKSVGPLDLGGLTSLSNAAAESLSKHQGDWLDLSGLASLSDAAAESLSKYEGPLDLDGLASLSDAAVESLSKHKGGWLDLKGLTSLSDAAAESLSKYEGKLNLDGLKEMSDAAAESLSNHQEGIYLSLDNLPGTAAAILQDYTDEIDEPSMADEDSADRPGDSSPGESALPPDSANSALFDDALADGKEDAKSDGNPKLKVDYKPLRKSPNTLEEEHWSLTESLGAGGFGDVWKAKNEKIRNPKAQFCVFKFINKKEFSYDNLENEIDKARTLEGVSGIVTLVPYLNAEIPCLQQPFVKGKDLFTVLEERYKDQENGPVPSLIAADIIHRLADIIASAHEQDPPIVHRDLKPENIMVPVRSPASWRAKKRRRELSQFTVIDFGISGTMRQKADSHTELGHSPSQRIQGERMGTWEYAPPEQLLGHPPHTREDVYALGRIWYGMLKGEHPRLSTTTNPEDLENLGEKPVGLSKSQVDLLKACLTKEETERIPHAMSLVERILDEYPELDDDSAVLVTISTENPLTVQWDDLDQPTNELAVEEARMRLTFADNDPEKLEDLLLDVTSLSVEAAEELIRFPGELLSLDGLKELSVPVAEVLVKFQGDNDGSREDNGNQKFLSFEKLNKLSLPVARVLARFQGDGAGLILEGLEELPAELAEVLAGYEGYWLFLNSVKELSIASAEALSRCHCKSLHLDGLIELGREAAEALAQFNGDTLTFDCFSELSVEVARALARFQGGSLFLSGLKTLTAEELKGLARFNGHYIYLTGLADMPRETAAALAQLNVNGLELEGLEDLSERAAQALVKFNGNGLILGIKRLTVALARVLGDFHSKLELPRIIRLSDEAAYTLSSGRAEVSLPVSIEMSDLARDKLERSGVNFEDFDNYPG